MSGTQPLNYDASDNVGVRSCAEAVVSGQRGRLTQRAVRAGRARWRVRRTASRARTAPGTSTWTRPSFPEGTQPLVVQAQDTAGNIGDSPPVTARIDNTPPARVEVGVEGGEQWRNSNDFALDVGEPAGDRSRADRRRPTTSCARPAGGSCIAGEQAGDGIARLAVQVPAPGEWTLSLWRRDAAGNADRRRRRCR